MRRAQQGATCRETAIDRAPEIKTLEDRLKQDDDLTGEVRGELSPEAAELTDTELTEQKMRRALGLDGPWSGRPLTLRSDVPQRTAPGLPSRSRPSRSINAAPNSFSEARATSPLEHRLAEVQEQLRVERQRHEEARQLLRRAELTARDAETRFQHDSLSQEDELAAVRQGAINAQRALDEALFEAQGRDSARRAAVVKRREDARPVIDSHGPIRASRAGQAVATGATGPAPQDSATSPPKKRGRPRTRPLPEPKPVRWWTPSYKANTKG